MRASRMASFDGIRSLKVRARRCWHAFVEDQVRTCSTALKRSSRSLSIGIRNGTPDVLIRCFARLILCAIVAGTKRSRFRQS